MVFQTSSADCHLDFRPQPGSEPLLPSETDAARAREAGGPGLFLPPLHRGPPKCVQPHHPRACTQRMGMINRGPAPDLSQSREQKCKPEHTSSPTLPNRIPPPPDAQRFIPSPPPCLPLLARSFRAVRVEPGGPRARRTARRFPPSARGTRRGGEERCGPVRCIAAGEGEGEGSYPRDLTS